MNFLFVFAAITVIGCSDSFGQIVCDLSINTELLQQKEVTESREIYSIRDSKGDLVKEVKLPKDLKGVSESLFGFFTFWSNSEPYQREHVPFLVDFRDQESWVVYKSCKKKDRYNFKSSETFYITPENFQFIENIDRYGNKHLYKICRTSNGPTIKNRPKPLRDVVELGEHIEFRKFNISTSPIPNSDKILGIIDKNINGNIDLSTDNIFLINENDSVLDYLLGSNLAFLKDISYLQLDTQLFRVKLIAKNSFSLDSVTNLERNRDSVLSIDSSLNSELTYRNLEDKKVSFMSTANGKYLLINYWGTWCAPCVEKIPDLLSLKNKFSSELEILSLNYRDDLVSIERFNTRYGVSWPQGKRDLINSKFFGQNGYPFLILISPEGKIIKNKIRVSEVGDLLEQR